MTIITTIRARQILDCKARPMVEVEIETSTGAAGRAAAPTGQSVGIHEAAVLRDHDPAVYDGLGVIGAVRTIKEEIAPSLLGRDFAGQREFDLALIELDGTEDKSTLGGNTIYPLSVAFLRAEADQEGSPVYEHIARGPLTTIPVPCFNMINGGRNHVATQAFNEFILVPYGATTIDEAVEIGVSVFNRLPELIERRTGHAPEIGKSQGFAAPFTNPRDVLSLLRKGVEEAGYTEKVAFALDCASSEMYDHATSTYELDGQRVSSAQLIDALRDLTNEFDILFIEDPLDEDDWEGFSLAVRELPRTYVVGDDLIVTNKRRLERALREHAVDGFVLKPNQIGTITEALETFDNAAQKGLITLPSGRSGGVIDDIVMDLSLGLQVPFQKNGAPRSGERIEKLNFLIRAAQRHPETALARLEELVRFKA